MKDSMNQPKRTAISLREWLAYRFDNFMALGPLAMLICLGGVTLFSIIFFSLVVWEMKIVPVEAAGDFTLVAWWSMLRTLDPGIMALDTGLFGVFMLILTVIGILLGGTLIGIISEAITKHGEYLRRGRSRVVEKGHTIVLGWSGQIFMIIDELRIANESTRDSCLVIMADRDKVWMEQKIKNRCIRNPRSSLRVVCRTGNPLLVADLDIVLIDDAKAIIVLSPEKDSPDGDVIKTVMAIVYHQDRKTDNYHIVAEIRDPKNQSVLQNIRLPGGKSNEVEIVLAGDIIARIIAHVCGHSGLSHVYADLLNFKGCEFYLKSAKEVNDFKQNIPFGDVMNLYQNAIVAGYCRKVKETGEMEVILKPRLSTPMLESDQLIFIAEDDSTIGTCRKTIVSINEDAFTSESWDDDSDVDYKVLMLGWNKWASVIIKELDSYLPVFCSITVGADLQNGEEAFRTIFRDQPPGIDVRFVPVVPTSWDDLDKLGVGGYDRVIVLSDDTVSSQDADTKTLITLQHLREISEKQSRSFSIVSEMRDNNNCQLAATTNVDDFVVSVRLVSRLLVQISERKEVARIFDDLFDFKGTEIQFKDVGLYIRPGKSVDFYTVVESARRKDEVAIGYRVKSEIKDKEKKYGVHLNPDKALPITFKPDDKIITLSSGGR